MRSHYGGQINRQVSRLHETEKLIQEARHDDVIVAALENENNLKFVAAFLCRPLPPFPPSFRKT